jgi:hypothetical protein
MDDLRRLQIKRQGPSECGRARGLDGSRPPNEIFVVVGGPFNRNRSQRGPREEGTNR